MLGPRHAAHQCRPPPARLHQRPTVALLYHQMWRPHQVSAAAQNVCVSLRPQHTLVLIDGSTASLTFPLSSCAHCKKRNKQMRVIGSDGCERGEVNKAACLCGAEEKQRWAAGPGAQRQSQSDTVLLELCVSSLVLFGLCCNCMAPH